MTDITLTTNHTEKETWKALSDAIDEIKEKVLFRLQTKGSGLFVDKHQCYGILAEEVKELLDALHANNTDAMKEEVKDIAVAAIWALASMIADDPKAELESWTEKYQDERR